jgi:hypothetical protein
MTIIIEFIANSRRCSCDCDGSYYDDAVAFLEWHLSLRSRYTNVECPKEKNIPIVTGGCPAATRRRVVRSIACADK